MTTKITFEFTTPEEARDFLNEHFHDAPASVPTSAPTPVPTSAPASRAKSGAPRPR